jgi:ABC-type glycerol-3-phosphate transport system substrate-binding protein
MRSFLKLVAALLLLAACSGKFGSSGNSGAPVSSSGDFNVTLSFDPTPPKQGNETITVVLKDSAGNPVKGATVAVTTTMPTMSMAAPT